LRCLRLEVILQLADGWINSTIGQSVGQRGILDQFDFVVVICLLCLIIRVDIYSGQLNTTLLGDGSLRLESDFKN
jgi:hypothetical protein